MLGDWLYAIGRFFRGLFTKTDQEKGKEAPTKEAIDKEIEQAKRDKFGK